MSYQGSRHKALNLDMGEYFGAPIGKAFHQIPSQPGRFRVGQSAFIVKPDMSLQNISQIGVKEERFLELWQSHFIKAWI